jgi:hypothetical protein
MVTLRNAVDGLKDNRTQLVEGGLADEAMLGDLDFQIGTLETRIAEVKATQTSENRTIEHDLSPERDRLVAAELRRQTATAQLIRRVLALKPAPCPPTLLHDYDTLERLRRELPDV